MKLQEQLRDWADKIEPEEPQAASDMRKAADLIDALAGVLRDTVRVIRKMPSPCPGHPMGPSEIAAVVNAAGDALAHGGGK